jgi:hypothetical protein
MRICAIKLLLHELSLGSSRVVIMLALAGVLTLGMGVVEGRAIALPSFPSSQAADLTNTTLAQATQPPQAMVNTLRQSLSKQTGIPAKKLRMVESTQTTWPNGCLGLAKADEMCTQMMVPGWRIVFSNGTQRWAYRTDATGRNYRLETPTQRSALPIPTEPVATASIQATQLSDTELPASLSEDELFRVIASGGLTGQTRQATLLQDGRMIRVRLNPDGSTTQLSVQRVASTQLSQFQKMVQQYLPRFDRCNYPATSGAADFITVTLTSALATVRYADIMQSRLPQELQTLVQTWNQMER